VSLLGIRQVVVLVNKMDLVGHSEEVFRHIEAAYRSFAAALPLQGITVIPTVAPRGDNIAAPSDCMPWYTGPTLLQVLETQPLESARGQAAAASAGNGSTARCRAFAATAGLLASGTLRAGDAVRAAFWPRAGGASSPWGDCWRWRASRSRAKTNSTWRVAT
jgi:bifunctional enzyme CysN/CysC